MNPTNIEIPRHPSVEYPQYVKWYSLTEIEGTSCTTCTWPIYCSWMLFRPKQFETGEIAFESLLRQCPSAYLCPQYFLLPIPFHHTFGISESLHRFQHGISGTGPLLATRILLRVNEMVLILPLRAMGPAASPQCSERSSEPCK